MSKLTERHLGRALLTGSPDEDDNCLLSFSGPEVESCTTVCGLHPTGPCYECSLNELTVNLMKLASIE